MPTAGAGVIDKIHKMDSCNRPFEVIFDDGEIHEYTEAAILEKFTSYQACARKSRSILTMILMNRVEEIATDDLIKHVLKLKWDSFGAKFYTFQLFWALAELMLVWGLAWAIKQESNMIDALEYTNLALAISSLLLSAVDIYTLLTLSSRKARLIKEATKRIDGRLNSVWEEDAEVLESSERDSSRSPQN